MAVFFNKDGIKVGKSVIFGAFSISLLSGFLLLATAGAAFAGAGTTVLENITTSSEGLPGLISGSAYVLGLVLGVLGVLKLKDHVENPQQTPLRTPMIRLLAGGGLFALPIVYQTMRATFDAGMDQDFDPGRTAIEVFEWLFSAISFSFLGNINGILSSIIDQIEGAPGFISALGYLLGLILGIAGLIKLKDHVENPDQTRMKEPIIRLLAGGAFFALPTIYQAMHDLVVAPGLLGQIMSGFAAASLIWSEWDLSLFGLMGCAAGNVLGPSVGSSLCWAILNAGALPAFLSALSYIVGLILGFWAILKIKDHVENPQQTSVWEGFSRLIAGGFFLAMPFLVEVIRNTVTPITLPAARAGQAAVTNYNEDIDGCEGLDGMVGCMMQDLLMPLHLVLNLFTLCAGMILIMIGISRLTKSAQDGPRGPGGLGTFLTFVVGGALLSYNEMIRAFTTSFFLNPLTLTYGELRYAGGMSADELQHAHNVISAVVKFMILVGMISFVRGLFIVRDVAEGNGQASLMAGMTHLIGGALAVNLGPLVNVVQATLGITDYGIGFGLSSGGGIGGFIGGLIGP